MPADLLFSVVRDHPVYPCVAEAMGAARIADGHPVIVAVSGGADSTALALLVAAWCAQPRHSIVLAYFDHEHDGARHAAEWQHVCDLARIIGARQSRGVAASFGDIGGRGLEETWRNRRYAFLSRLAGPEGLILTGHTMDDVAETFLMTAVRGGSGSAMAGPRAARCGVVRPLLATRRDALRDLLRQTGVGWIEDPTNVGDRPRAWLRAHVIPAVTSRFGPSAVEGLARSAQMVEEWSEAIDAHAVAAARLCVRRDREETLLDLALLESYPRAVRRRMLRGVLSSCGLPSGARLSAPVEGLLRLCDGARSRRLQLPGGVSAVRSCGFLRIAPTPSLPAATETVLPLPGCVAFGAWVLTASVVWAGEGWTGRMPRDPSVAMLDRDAVCEPLHVRARQRGDRIVPMGMEGTVRLKSYLRDCGVPLWSRWCIPLVCDANGRIVWIPGIVRSQDAPIIVKTTRILLLHSMAARMREEECGA
ncbi:tRNA lysidine(34) synthetase TilS [Candidatus Fermentibacteria bacterium]|nr:tRNA lysidine(34) synthetase TilS [Candidatus Fermentibacteria bacterium]